MPWLVERFGWMQWHISTAIFFIALFITLLGMSIWEGRSPSVRRKGFMPIEKPVMGNVLAIGDSAAFAEVENQGALMCGYHAGHAVRKEMEGKDGFQDYIDWWLKLAQTWIDEKKITPHYLEKRSLPCPPAYLEWSAQRYRGAWVCGQSPDHRRGLSIPGKHQRIATNHRRMTQAATNNRQ